MQKLDYHNLSDQALLAEKKAHKKAKITHAVIIGFMFGVVSFGVVAWLFSTKRHVGFLIPMLLPIFLIYKMIKNPKTNPELEEALKNRSLD